MIDVLIKISNKTESRRRTQLLIIMFPKKGKLTSLPEILNHQPHQIHAESRHECLSRNSKLKRYSMKNIFVTEPEGAPQNRSSDA